MKIMKAVIPVALTAALGVGGCTTMEDIGPKEGVGTVLGGAAGAIAGNQIGSGSGKVAATAIGTLLGAYAGREIGASLDRADRQAMRETTGRALESNPSGTASTWRNPDSGNRGSIEPVRTWRDDSGRPCREFTSTIYVDGEAQTARGTACRQSDGTWKIIE